MKKLSALILAVLASVGTMAIASPIVSGFDQNSLGRNDDGYAGFLLPGGFSLRVNGVTTSQLYVSNNGTVSLATAFHDYTSNSFNAAGVNFLAPFLADIDTRSEPSGVVSYGMGSFGGHDTFGVNWPGVAAFGGGSPAKLNSFQLLLVNRSDTGSGNADFYFNYDAVNWDSGAARVGYNLAGGTDFEFAGSGVAGKLLDTGVEALSTHSNIGVLGRYGFTVRNGEIHEMPAPATDLPVPGSLALFGAGALALLSRRRKA
jgi:uncharacterized protein (TIGR03382 family)